MTFDIWQITYDSYFEYLFLSSEGHYSSNMDSLEQLFDLGLDDPDLAMSDYKASIIDLQSYKDCTYLFTVPELDYDLAIDLYPEYFIRFMLYTYQMTTDPITWPTKALYIVLLITVLIMSQDTTTGSTISDY